MHAVVYVADNLVFTKNGASDNMSFRLQDLAEVNGIYLGGLPTRCALLPELPSPKQLKGCKMFSTVYRCRPHQEYLDDYAGYLASSPRELIDDFQKVEEVLRAASRLTVKQPWDKYAAKYKEPFPSFIPDPLTPRDRELWPQAQDLLKNPMEDFYRSSLATEPEPQFDQEIVDLLSDKEKLETFARTMAGTLSRLANTAEGSNGKHYLQYMAYRISMFSRGKGLDLDPNPVTESEQRWGEAMKAALGK